MRRLLARIPRSWLTAAAGVVAGGALSFGLAAVAVEPDPCVPVPEFGVKVCPIDTTTTTSTPATSSTTPTTTTSLPPATTTTTLPPVVSTTAPPSTTTTTAAPTTTVPPSTTLPPSSETITLTDDWLITGVDVRSNFIVEANGHEIECRGCVVWWTDFEIHHAARVMFHMGAGVSLLRDGVVADSGVAGQLGSYPLHFHLNGDSTRGTLIERVTVRDSLFRAFVPHGSNGITIRDSRCENVAGECVWWDFPGTNDPDGCGGGSVCDFVDNSNDTLVDGVVADGVHPWEGARGFRMSAFMLGAGTGNTIRNSTALNVTGARDCSGFHWPEFGSGHGRGQPLTWGFENNTADNPDPDCHGIFVWQNDDQDHVVSGFTGDGIGHGAYVNDYHYQGLDVPYVEAHAAGWSISDSHIGVFEALRHRNLTSPTVEFTNVTFDRFIVNNATNGGEVRGVYKIDGTNLTCGDIEYQSVVAGTKVVIDGQEC